MTEPKAPIHIWSAEPPSGPVRASLERLARTGDVAHVAAMPDIHLADDVCVGCVLATRGRIYPEAVGGDIGCGMAAMRFDREAAVLADRQAAAALVAYLGRAVPASRRPAGEAALPRALAERPLSSPRLEAKKRAIGRVQFATLGRGNHFIELQRDQDGALWLMVHSGSRGMGQAIRDEHARRGARSRTGLAYVPAASAAGSAYLSDLAWALAYARQSRRRMAELVAEGMERLFRAAPDPASYIDCHHNFVRQEHHAGEDLWVHRKGAISAAAGEPGIIPGSMGSPSFHVTGRGNPASLASSSHGAGRTMSRGEARRAISTRTLMEQMRGIWFDHRLAERLRDEAPGAYKDIGAVMRAQRALTRIERQLAPVLSYKGV